MSFVKFIVAIVASFALFSNAEKTAPTWVSGTATKVTSLCGVFSTAPNEVYGAVLDNALGNGALFSDDYATTSQFFGPAGAMNMDIAYSKDGTTGAMVGVGGLFIGPAKSAEFKKASGIRAITQNVEAFSTSGFAAAGEFTDTTTHKSANGLAVSTNNGVNWALYDIGLNSTSFPARYAAVPSDNTWYVSAGAWPYDESQVTMKARLSSKLAVHFDGEKHSVRFTNKASAEDTGYTGAIARTTDAGKTWTQVFDSKGSMYMNAISCADETHCVAVGENGDAAFAVTTSDGVNWATTLTAPAGISLIAAKTVGPAEYWVAGGGQEGRGALTGYYYHTLDGGATWTLSTLPGYVMDLSFASATNGYSAFITNSFSSINVYR
jgi:hypothetical protein